MRGLGRFQMDQMRKDDPRVPQLFKSLQSVLDLLEDIVLHPHQEPPPKPNPPPAPPPVRLPLQDKLAYSIKDVRGLTGLSNATIYAQIKEGKLRSAKSGGRTLILAQDLHTWIDGWSRR